ncbi:hypothetical protein SAMN05421847_0221 [Halpernia humi]|uniref:Uncharacterized protein n=1 Tax=Halpernia humi TaxID=493375 RepID=A0A1H5SRG0_9FLAO|nr:hypothetical protein SAMN05421847_0221 [Halpernia humi]
MYLPEFVYYSIFKILIINNLKISIASGFSPMKDVMRHLAKANFYLKPYKTG